MKKSSMIIAIVILVVAIFGVVVLMMHKKNNPSATTASTASSGAAAATITYSSSGFSPATITVKSGDTVAIKNTDTEDIQLASDPHPIHTDDADLNVGQVAPGQTKTFTVTKKGSFGYHNHLDPSDKGQIVIE